MTSFFLLAIAIAIQAGIIFRLTGRVNRLEREVANLDHEIYDIQQKTI